MRLVLIIFSVVLLNSAWAQKFDDHEFLNAINKTQYRITDRSFSFLINLSENNIEEAEKIFPVFKKMDVKHSLVTVDGETYLNGLSAFLRPYMKNSDTLLMATQYLKKKYNTKNPLYDNMLRACLRLDSSNYTAMYFLAKLRHEHGFTDDRDYLIYRMKDLHYYETSWIAFFEQMIVFKNEPLSEFLKKDVYYFEE